ncbi:MAG: hypothetical protein ACXWQ5_00060 [Ktedonobacterales bacterium]
MEQQQQHRQVVVRPITKDGTVYAEVRLVSVPPCQPRSLSIGELETLIEDAQRVVAMMRWNMATYFVTMDPENFERDTRHLAFRDVVEGATGEMRTVCGRAIHSHWSFSPLVYDIKTVYNLCHTCARLYSLRHRDSV